ncbi:L-lysine 2,3-aminomutase [Sinobacterium norvegicum]|uniref:L-lysine 2,3-aminomutase n=1 Tax=Sinobacterium norvegicum TaxID=1641715 RepID=A0ABM9AEP2_9GAMM|nr:EF-P beta-lysylation protein EpmB [Sinobacterium norvegicum]CAH0991673.1 L-lysine 2,3-aminomutase [Sinobacterium norvegicum]
MNTPDTIAFSETKSWQQQLSEAISSSEELITYLQLPRNLKADIDQAIGSFALRAPYAYLQRIKKGDINDPLLKQILPISRELVEQPGFTADPLEEQQANPAPGIIHKYPGRVLLMPTSACAINCRYCFRRHFPYEENTPSRQQWQQSLDYLRHDSSIHEVILSGGDPLASSDKQLAWLSQQLSDIPHIKELRIHSRFPIVIPDRINDEFLAWTTATRLNVVVVVHCNHPQEIDEDVLNCLRRIQKNGLILLNQAVLLRDVNNKLKTLSDLSQRLVEAGCIPYYLHLLDKVQGAQHFDIDEAEAIGLHRAMAQSMPGYMVPRLVKEQAGKSSKTII